MVHLHSPPWNIPDTFNSAFSLVAHDHIIYNVAAQGGLKSAPACRLRWANHHLKHSINEQYLTVHCSCHPSVLRLFIGLAVAARMVWMLSVMSAATSNPAAPPRNTQAFIGVR
jgi:hypothetical protein